ncbi:HotDog domain-containing protein [Mariannaea sp. PMI_226]|nr:HotDog domain-containing protein [Mariannaea sp. PMI_226]
MSHPSDNRLLCPRLGLAPPEISLSQFEDEISFFNSVPWTAALLNEADAIPFLPACRTPASDVHDQFFGRTLHNDRGIQHMISIFRISSAAAALDPGQVITEVDTLVYVGSGITGFANVVHGGIVASLLDEAMGCIFDLNIALEKESPTFQTSNVTGALNVTYLKKVPTNSLLLLTAKVEAFNGRKTTIQCQLRDETREVLAKCESTWVGLKSSL